MISREKYECTSLLINISPWNRLHFMSFTTVNEKKRCSFPATEVSGLRNEIFSLTIDLNVKCLKWIIYANGV